MRAYPSSRWKSPIGSAPTAATQTYCVSTRWLYVHRSITLRGLGMFDVLHGQTVVAPHGVELHPVTGATFHKYPGGGGFGTRRGTSSARYHRSCCFPGDETDLSLLTPRVGVSKAPSLAAACQVGTSVM